SPACVHEKNNGPTQRLLPTAVLHRKRRAEALAGPARRPTSTPRQPQANGQGGSRGLGETGCRGAPVTPCLTPPGRAPLLSCLARSARPPPSRAAASAWCADGAVRLGPPSSRDLPSRLNGGAAMGPLSDCVLIVEDNADAAESLRLLLESRGVRAEVAPD